MVCPINPIMLVGQKNKKYFNVEVPIRMLCSRFDYIFFKELQFYRCFGVIQQILINCKNLSGKKLFCFL